MSNRVAVYRKEHFNAAHRLNNPDWDEATNERVFGKCNNPHFHGHNYELVIKLTGEPDPATGYVMDMKLLSDLVQENVIERFDHKNLNEDTAERVWERANAALVVCVSIISKALSTRSSIEQPHL